MSNVTVTVYHAAQLGDVPGDIASIVGTLTAEDAYTVTVNPDIRTPGIVRQHGPDAGPIQISRQHIIELRRHRRGWPY